MSPALISATASGIVALILQLIPPVKRQWDKLESVPKQVIMALVVIVVSIGALFYSCRYDAVCPGNLERTIVDMVLTVFAGLLGSVAGYESTNYIGDKMAYRNVDS